MCIRNNMGLTLQVTHILSLAHKSMIPLERIQIIKIARYDVIVQYCSLCPIDKIKIGKKLLSFYQYQFLLSAIKIIKWVNPKFSFFLCDYNCQLVMPIHRLLSMGYRQCGNTENIYRTIDSTDSKVVMIENSIDITHSMDGIDTIDSLASLLLAAYGFNADCG